MPLSTRPKNIQATVSMVIVAKPNSDQLEIGTVLSMVHTKPIDQHLLTNKLDHLVPCDGREIDRQKFPELYRMMENAWPAGAPVTTPDLKAEQQAITLSNE